jgi:lysophospholipase L1-like esterase
MTPLKIEHRKFLKNGFGLVVFLCVVLFLVESTTAYLVKHSNNAQTGKINLVMQHQIDSEIMMFGSSLAEVGLHPQIIEKHTKCTTYNMGIDGSTISNSEFLINEFLSYSENCKSIVIGMAFFSFTTSEKLNAPERFLAYKSNPNVKQNILKIQPSLDHKLYYAPFYSFIIANHTYYKNAFSGLKNLMNDKYWVKDSLKGFVPHYTKYYDTRKEGKQLNHVPIADKAYDNYKRIIEKIKAHNITPILVLMPMHVNGQESFSNFETYRKNTKILSEETDVKLFDFSEHDVTTRDKYYYNNGHLNANGANVFSAVLADSIKLGVQLDRANIKK